MPKTKKVPMPDELREWFRKQGSLGGKKGNANMSKKARRERALKAVQAREAKRGKTT